MEIHRCLAATAELAQLAQTAAAELAQLAQTPLLSLAWPSLPGLLRCVVRRRGERSESEVI